MRRGWQLECPASKAPKLAARSLLHQPSSSRTPAAPGAPAPNVHKPAAPSARTVRVAEDEEGWVKVQALRPAKQGAAPLAVGDKGLLWSRVVVVPEAGEDRTMALPVEVRVAARWARSVGQVEARWVLAGLRTGNHRVAVRLLLQKDCLGPSVWKMPSHFLAGKAWIVQQVPTWIL